MASRFRGAFFLPFSDFSNDYDLISNRLFISNKNLFIPDLAMFPDNIIVRLKKNVYFSPTFQG